MTINQKEQIISELMRKEVCVKMSRNDFATILSILDLKVSSTKDIEDKESFRILYERIKLQVVTSLL